MNDERPIEKLLRRAAKKRSDEAGPPPELHPANRRSLQAEVTRQFPKPGAAKQSALAEFWAGLTQRWIYAVGVLVVLGVAAIAILPTLLKSKSQTNLAQSARGEDREAMEFAKNTPVAPEPVAAPATVVMESDSVRAIRLDDASKLGAVTETASTAPVRTVPPEPMVVSGAIPPPIRAESKAKPMVAGETADTFSRAIPASAASRTQPARDNTGNEFSGRSGGGNLAEIWARPGSKTEEKKVVTVLGAGPKEFDSLRTASVGKSALAPAGAAAEGFADKSWIARGGGPERERAVFNSQAYSNAGVEQLPARKKEALAFKDLVPVLANFKIEQQGRQLQVVDGDGSVYRGVVDEENTLYKQVVSQQSQKLSAAYDNNLKFQSPKAAGAIARQQAPDYYLYRVEGTNRTLNQNVVFTWNFIETNALAAGNQTFNNAAQKLDAARLPSQFPALLQNSFITGRAQFGEGKEIEVNAVPTTP